MKLILPILGMTVISFGQPKYLPVFPHIETVAGVRVFDWLWWRVVWLPEPEPSRRSANVNPNPPPAGPPPVVQTRPAGGTGPMYLLPWPATIKLQTPPSSGQTCPLCHQHTPKGFDN